MSAKAKRRVKIVNRVKARAPKPKPKPKRAPTRKRKRNAPAGSAAKRAPRYGSAPARKLPAPKFKGAWTRNLQAGLDRVVDLLAAYRAKRAAHPTYRTRNAPAEVVWVAHTAVRGEWSPAAFAGGWGAVANDGKVAALIGSERLAFLTIAFVDDEGNQRMFSPIATTTWRSLASAVATALDPNAARFVDVYNLETVVGFRLSLGPVTRSTFDL